jgi:hypothetical protein
MSELVFFRRTTAGFEPTPLAAGLWSSATIHGVAASGLLAKGMEEELGPTDLAPARYHVDLFRPARMVPTRVRVRVVRRGPRLALLDAELVQDSPAEPGTEVVCSRASATFLRATAPTAGAVWGAADRAVPPPLDLAPETDEPHVPWFHSDTGWSQSFADHQNAGRHATWQTALPTVAGEKMTPFQAVAAIADATSMVTNWGAGGIEYINTDISLALARLPTGVQVGLRTLEHLAADGVAVGTAEVFDRAGSIGTATVTALANTRRTVDLSSEGVDPTTRA